MPQVTGSMPPSKHTRECYPLVVFIQILCQPAKLSKLFFQQLQMLPATECCQQEAKCGDSHRSNELGSVLREETGTKDALYRTQSCHLLVVFRGVLSEKGP